MRILILGSTGMIGNAIFTVLNRVKSFKIIGSYQNLKKSKMLLNDTNMVHFNLNHDCKYDMLFKEIKNINPEVIINCIGIIKHKQQDEDIKNIIFLNSLLPHYLSEISIALNCRFLHISTDCIFSGKKGNYLEEDLSDAEDIYGKTKFLGEGINNKNLVIRTSTIGHEIFEKHGLLEWFLEQNKNCFGFKNAYFSGLTNIELANIIRDNIIPNNKIRGLYHVGGIKINKFSLLNIISDVYKKQIKIKEDKTYKVDRSFCSKKFYKDTNYEIKEWNILIQNMYLTNKVIYKNV